MPNRGICRRSAAAAAGALLIAFAVSCAAGDIVNDWDSVKPPPRPELKAVTLAPSTTALLILDMMKQNCGPRPSCRASVPTVKRLNDAARKAGVLVWYAVVGAEHGDVAAEMVDPALAPRSGEWSHTRGPDKFFGTDLEKRLKEHGIRTVVLCGASFQTSVLSTGMAAAERGYKVIVPVDCTSSVDPYREQYSAWQFYKGGSHIVTRNSTLTRSTMIRFGK